METGDKQTPEATESLRMEQADQKGCHGRRHQETHSYGDRKLDTGSSVSAEGTAW